MKEKEELVFENTTLQECLDHWVQTPVFRIFKTQNVLQKTQDLLLVYFYICPSTITPGGWYPTAKPGMNLVKAWSISYQISLQIPSWKPRNYTGITP